MNRLMEKQLTLDSREVAEMVEKRHDHLMRDISTYIEYLNQNPDLGADDFFIENSYKSGTGKDYKKYDCTKKGCELITHKLTGEKGVVFSARYIERFHEMESRNIKPLTKREEMKLYIETLEEQDAKIEAVNKEVQELKQDMPLLAIDCDRIITAVKTKGVNYLGGKDTPAYRDASARAKVYSDIYGQLKREFGVSTYKAIKRNQCDLAINTVKAYKLPLAISEQVNELNNQMSFI